MPNEIELTVQMALEDDIYKDLVRVPYDHRGGIREGTVCAFTTADKKPILRSVRGIVGEQSPVIQMDLITRGALGLAVGKRYKFSIREVGWLGQFLWAWNASEPASRLAARLGILGLVLGVIGLFLGLN